MKYLYTSIVPFFGFLNAVQPKIERWVFGISNSSFQTQSVILDWTLGVTAISFHVTSSRPLTDGFQLAYNVFESYSVIDNNVYEVLLILPNPSSSSSFVFFKFLNEIKEITQRELFYITGRSLQQNVFDLSAEHEIDIRQYSDVLYVMKISCENCLQIY